MREIGALPDEQQAETFFDYLTARGVAASIERETDDSSQPQWTIWIHEEDQVEQAREELAGFLADPDAVRFREAAEVAHSLRKQNEQQQKKLRKQQIEVRDTWQKPLHQVIPVTMTLIFASVTLSVASDFGRNVEPIRTALSISRIESAGTDRVRFERNNGLREVREGQVWRVFTPMFLHLGVIHLLFNMYWLFQFGLMLEPRGWGRYVFLVLVLAASSAIGQYFMAGPNFGGMSGVGYGLFGYIWLRSRLDPWSNFHLSPQIVFLFVIWFFVCLTGSVGPIANTAHGVGLGVGMLWGYLDSVSRTARG